MNRMLIERDRWSWPWNFRMQPVLFVRALGGRRLQADGVHGNDAVGVLLAGLGLRVGESHRHERLRGRVAVLQVLKDRAAERVLALLGNVGEELAVALDDEAGQSAFEIGFGFPGQSRCR